MRTENTITYFEAIRRAAIHFYDAPGITKYIEDAKGEMRSPEEARKYAIENALQMRILREEYQDVYNELQKASEHNEIECFRKKLEHLDSKIAFHLKEWTSEADLDAYEQQYILKKKKAALMEKITRAVRDRKLTFNLTTGECISIENLTDPEHGQFFPAESMGEFLIAGQTLRGIVVVDERKFTVWLTAQDVEEGRFDTPEKRIMRAKQLYRARLLDERFKHLSKIKHFSALLEAIPGLQRKEFESVRRFLETEFPFITKPGRPRKSNQKSI